MSQSPPPILRTELAEVIASVELRDVRLMSGSVQTRIRDASTVPDPQLKMRHGTKVIARKENGFLVAAMMRTEIVAGSSNKDATEAPPAVSMMVTFALEYWLPGASGFSDDVLGEFARVNGAFNAWPYWREYIQTTAARMNLPPILLPVFRVKHSPPQEKAPTKTATPKARAATRSATKKR